MALFKKQQDMKTETATTTTTPVVARASAVTVRKHPTAIIKAPRVTEKAAAGTTAGVYVFDVALSATKHEIARAVAELYKVTPTQVRVVRTAGKQVQNRRTRVVGRTARQKKAVVTLKKGETIDIS